MPTAAAHALTEARVSRRLLRALAGVAEPADSTDREVAVRLDALVAERCVRPFVVAPSQSR